MNISVPLGATHPVGTREATVAIAFTSTLSVRVHSNNKGNYLALHGKKTSRGALVDREANKLSHRKFTKYAHFLYALAALENQR